MLIACSICYLTIVTWSIIVDARTALGLTRTNVPGIESLLAVGGKAEVPSDSLLSSAQVHLCLRIADLADSLEQSKVKKQYRLQAFARILNDHATSRATYVWMRSALVAALVDPKTHSDSLNAHAIHIMKPHLGVVKRVYRAHLDTLIMTASKQSSS